MNQIVKGRGERERLFGSRERELETATGREWNGKFEAQNKICTFKSFERAQRGTDKLKIDLGLSYLSILDFKKWQYISEKLMKGLMIIFTKL